MATDSSVSASGLQAVLDLMAEGGAFGGSPPPPTKYYDSSYVEAALRQ
jgi:hypothetical protein